MIDSDDEENQGFLHNAEHMTQQHTTHLSNRARVGKKRLELKYEFTKRSYLDIEAEESEPEERHHLKKKRKTSRAIRKRSRLTGMELNTDSELESNPHSTQHSSIGSTETEDLRTFLKFAMFEEDEGDEDIGDEDTLEDYFTQEDLGKCTYVSLLH